MELTSSQRQAIDYFTAYAKKYKRDAEATIHHVLNMSNISVEMLDQAVHHIKTHAQIGLHFHPDRPTSTMKTVAQSLHENGEYKSQFETFISNGKVSPHSGGDRDRWEESMFGGAYQSDGTLMSERPKYGALNLMLHPDGPSPRFGSCYFLLSPNVSSRSTYTYLDSHQNPFEKGTYQAFDMIKPDPENETIFSFFKEDDPYFPTEQQVMLNFQVHDLNEMMQHLERVGVPLAKEKEVSEFGQFIWIKDPEGRLIELWEK